MTRSERAQHLLQWRVRHLPTEDESSFAQYAATLIASVERASFRCAACRRFLVKRRFFYVAAAATPLDAFVDVIEMSDDLSIFDCVRWCATCIGQTPGSHRAWRAYEAMFARVHPELVDDTPF